MGILMVHDLLFFFRYRTLSRDAGPPLGPPRYCHSLAHLAIVVLRYSLCPLALTDDVSCCPPLLSLSLYVALFCLLCFLLFWIAADCLSVSSVFCLWCVFWDHLASQTVAILVQGFTPYNSGSTHVSCTPGTAICGPRARVLCTNGCSFLNRCIWGWWRTEKAAPSRCNVKEALAKLVSWPSSMCASLWSLPLLLGQQVSVVISCGRHLG